jgi:hypothetical protein
MLDLNSHPLPVPQLLDHDLDLLAHRIRCRLTEVKDLSRSALRLALDIGDDLDAAQEQVPDGQWAVWLRKNCALSERSARLYRQLANHREEIEHRLAEAPELSLRAARSLITKSKVRSAPPAPETVTGAVTPLPVPETITAGQILAWWGNASRGDRREILERFGLSAILETVPEWRGDLASAMRARGKNLIIEGDFSVQSVMTPGDRLTD